MKHHFYRAFVLAFILISAPAIAKPIYLYCGPSAKSADASLNDATVVLDEKRKTASMRAGKADVYNGPATFSSFGVDFETNSASLPIVIKYHIDRVASTLQTLQYDHGRLTVKSVDPCTRHPAIRRAF